MVEEVDEVGCMPPIGCLAINAVPQHQAQQPAIIPAHRHQIDVKSNGRATPPLTNMTTRTLKTTWQIREMEGGIVARLCEPNHDLIYSVPAVHAFRAVMDIKVPGQLQRLNAVVGTPFMVGAALEEIPSEGADAAIHLGGQRQRG